jgi:hypothetical protein
MKELVMHKTDELSIVSINVTDRCNFRCAACHWFSDAVTTTFEQKTEDYLAFFRRVGPIDRLQITGGEPTVWPGFAELINRLPDSIDTIAVFTNGSRLREIQNIRRNNVYLRISLHAETDLATVAAIVAMAKTRAWRIKICSFGREIGSNRPKEFAGLTINYQEDQTAVGVQHYGHLLGKRVLCKPKMAYFATDGKAYCCEHGLRTKDSSYAYSFDLWAGQVSLPFVECTVKSTCLGCFDTEQIATHLNGDPLIPTDNQQ